MSDILDRIVQVKKREVAAGKAAAMARVDRGGRRSFAAALRRPGVGLIAEIKRASPSKGLIRADFDPVAIAKDYEQAGAAAVSVLTDREFFQGDVTYLGQVRAAVGLPLLRKDFIIDPWQLEEAAAAGADAVLLIARLLPEQELARFIAIAGELGLDCLVEVHDEPDLERALGAGATIVGINNRDLATFTVDLATTARLRPQVPAGVTVVAESGIKGPADVRALAALGVDAVLIGETLMRADRPGEAARELVRAGEVGP